MKHLKTKLMASVAMLMVATVMMSSASFAWFTISTAPEVKGIDTSCAANGNLEIALASDAEFATTPADSAAGDTGKNIAWGSIVDISQAADKIELKPVSLSNDGKFSVPTFGTDGRISTVAEATKAFKTITELNSSATGNFSDGGVTTYADANGNIWAMRVDFFMRTNTAGSVSLIEAATATGTGSGTDGTGTTISEDVPVTVAFQVNGGTIVPFYTPVALTTSTSTDGKAHAAGWDFTTPIFTAAATAATGVVAINTPVKVSMYVYWNGAGMTNSDFDNVVKDVKLNVQFTHSETLKKINAPAAS